jgi:NAD(P)-dependent dehydrogenase (short-subunit alcohol dehydrogenase family)
MEPAAAAPVAVITGASAGIGRATALAFARRGWRVALVARGAAGLEGARLDAERLGTQALVIEADVGNAPEVDRVATAVMDRWSRMDVWVNNAMLTTFGPAETVTAGEWERVTRVTYLGAVHGTLAALRHMRRAGQGVIVQVGSALAYRSIPLQAPYCAAKSALRGFTDSVRCELIHDRSPVRLVMVHLPGVNTPQFAWSRTHMPRRHRPLGTVYHPDAAAEAIYRAAIEAPRESWIGPPVLEAVLGTFFGPGLLDRLLARRAYEPQLTPAAGDTRFDILEAPAQTDHGMEGPFPHGARPRAVSINPAWVRGTMAGALVGAFAAALLARRALHAARRGRRP